jgi:hypothetical protein
VVDIAMPPSLSGEDCIEAACGIRSIDPRMGVLMLSEFAEEQYLGIVRQVLDDPDREQLVDVLVRERLVRDDLRRGLEHRARCAAVDEFASLLSGNHPESVWQRWSSGPAPAPTAPA